MVGCGLQEESDGLPHEKYVAFLHRRRHIGLCNFEAFTTNGKNYFILSPPGEI